MACASSAVTLCNFILRHERAPTITFVAVQSIRARDLAEQYEIDHDGPRAFLFLENNRMPKKSDAVIAASHHLNGFATVLKFARFVPNFIVGNDRNFSDIII